MLANQSSISDVNEWTYAIKMRTAMFKYLENAQKTATRKI